MSLVLYYILLRLYDVSTLSFTPCPLLPVGGTLSVTPSGQLRFLCEIRVLLMISDGEYYSRIFRTTMRDTDNPIIFIMYVCEFLT